MGGEFAKAETANMGRHVVLDVRGMEAPEPLDRVLATIARFTPTDQLKLSIDEVPKRLYEILERGGFSYYVKPGAEAKLEITIWPKAA